MTFPSKEVAQFCQILMESLDFFVLKNLDKKNFSFVDHKTPKLFISYNLALFHEFVM